MIKNLLFIAALFISSVTVAQTTSQEYARAAEQQRRAQTMQQLDSAIILMDAGKYEIADKKFLYVLSAIRSVPSDLTFHFGKNSFYMGKFKQSIDWLNKYIQLKGSNGQYSNEAVVLLKQAEGEFLKEQSKEQIRNQEILSNSFDIDCGPSGKVSCPVCKGNHVIIKMGAFGETYKTCPYCNENGILTCEEYNKLLRGDLKKKL